MDAIEMQIAASGEGRLGVFAVVMLILFVGLVTANVIYDHFNPRD